MKKKQSWIIVQDKKTYLFLLSIPVAIIYLIYDAINIFSQPQPETMVFVAHAMVASFLVLICVIFFVKFNTYSHWMNSDHPKPEK